MNLTNTHLPQREVGHFDCPEHDDDGGFWTSRNGGDGMVVVEGDDNWFEKIGEIW